MTVQTDPLEGTDLGLAPTPEGMVGFGVAELGYLLALHPGPTTTRSREWVGLDDTMTSNELVLLCGASSLTARGMVAGEDGETRTRSSAALLEVAVGRTTRWTRLGLLSPQGGLEHPVFFFQTPEVCALVEPSATVTWWTLFGDASDDPGTLLAGLVTSRLQEPGQGILVDVTEADGTRRNLLLAVEDDGRLGGRADVGPGGEGGSSVDVPRDDLAQVLRSLVPAVSA